jgi:hypothetical protein
MQAQTHHYVLAPKAIKPPGRRRRRRRRKLTNCLEGHHRSSVKTTRGKRLEKVAAGKKTIQADEKRKRKQQQHYQRPYVHQMYTVDRQTCNAAGQFSCSLPKLADVSLLCLLPFTFSKVQQKEEVHSSFIPSLALYPSPSE